MKTLYRNVLTTAMKTKQVRNQGLGGKNFTKFGVMVIIHIEMYEDDFIKLRIINT